MKIFLSHASEQRAQADRLALALRARRHIVFLDADDLPASGDYQSRIRQAIEECDLFCFLISPESVAARRFTLSEIGFARRRWPVPTGRVVPIMVEKVPIDLVPAYLRAVSILDPQGDFVADSLAAIEELEGTHSRRWRPAVAGLGAVLLLGAAVYGGYSHWRADPAPAGSAQPADPVPTSPGSRSSGLRNPAAEKLDDTASRFGVYMKALGFRGLDDRVTVYLFSKQSPLPGDLGQPSDTVNAFYQDGTLYLHSDLSGDMSVLLREYTHHILSKTAGAGVTIGNSDVENGLADYFPASFLQSPLIGEGVGPLFGLRTSYIRRLDNAVVYTSAPDDAHARGEAWSGALWSCRESVGQRAVDRAPAGAWTAAFASVTPQASARFGKALLDADTPARGCLAQQLQRRRLPH